LLCGAWSRRRLWSLGAAVLVVPLFMFAPSEGAAAKQVTPAGGVSWQVAAVRDSTGIVPNVVFWDFGSAVAAVQAAGFAVQTGAGSVDCGPTYVQEQSPVGGTSAPVGSTVVFIVNRQPPPGTDCP
jgi:PASTA domain-containing protein